MSDTEQGNGKAIQKSDNKTADNRVALQQILTARESEIKRLAGSLFTAERCTSLALFAVGGNDLLRKCSISSVVGAVLASARAGLEIDGVHAAIVPTYNGRLGGYEASFWPMYRGLVARAYDDPTVQEISARVVYEGEHFRPIYGTNDSIEHEPDADAVAAGNVVAAYAVVHMRGRAKFELMYRSQIDGIMERAPMVAAAKRNGKTYSGPWSTDYDEQAKKTVLKRLTKTAPIKSQRLSAAVALDDDNDRADIVDAQIEPEKTEPPPQRKTRTASVKEKMAAETPTTMPETAKAVNQPSPVVEVEPEMINDAQRRRILDLCDGAGQTAVSQRLALISTLLGHEVTALGALTSKQALEVIDVLSGQAEVRRRTQHPESRAVVEPPIENPDDDPAMGDR